MSDIFKTTLRLEEPLNERVRIKMAKARVRSIQAAVEQALELWLKSDGQKVAAAPAAAAAEPSEWHAKLTEILASGDEATINAVTQNIDVFHDRLRPVRRKKAG